jgi:hypothetical protein
MMENIAHGGPGGDPIGPFTIYTWGNGAALAAAATVWDDYGDVFVDGMRGQAFGVDGCTAEIRGREVRIQDRYGRQELTVVYASGRRELVPLQEGKASVRLR